MKKRKPPIVLATCLILMLVAVGIFYSPGRAAAVGEHGEEQAPPPPSAEQGDRPKISSDQVSSMAKGAMATPSKPGMPRTAGGPNNRPSIAIPKQQAYKPKPNDSSTSTQWYTNETKR